MLSCKLKSLPLEQEEQQKTIWIKTQQIYANHVQFHQFHPIELEPGHLIASSSGKRTSRMNQL